MGNNCYRPNEEAEEKIEKNILFFDQIDSGNTKYKSLKPKAKICCLRSCG